MPFKRKAGPGCESKGPNKRAGNLVPGGGRGKAAADDGSDEELGEEVIFTFADQVALAATVEELGHGPPQLQPGFKKFAKAEQKRKKEQFRTVYRRYQARIVEWQAAKEDVQAELEALAELHESLVKEDYRELTGETDEDADVTFTGKDVQRFTSQILTLNAFVREREKGLDDLSHLRRLGTCEAAERVAPMFFISPVTVERTYAVWKKRGMKLRQSKKGRWNRHWLLAEEDLKADALKYIREKADPKGERAMTAESFAAWISTIINDPKKVPDRTKFGLRRPHICARTAANWLHQLGCRHGRHRLGQYYDNHDRADVVEYRNEFLARNETYLNNSPVWALVPLTALSDQVHIKLVESGDSDVVHGADGKQFAVLHVDDFDDDFDRTQLGDLGGQHHPEKMEKVYTHTPTFEHIDNLQQRQSLSLQSPGFHFVSVLLVRVSRHVYAPLRRASRARAPRTHAPVSPPLLKPKSSL